MRTVLITGVSRGIGKALASKFLANGDFVIGTSTGGKSDLKHQNLIVFQLELSQSKSTDDCVKRIFALKRKIDILVNNAGTWMPTDKGPEIDIDSLRKTLEVNMIGPADFTQQLIPLIVTDGHIVNVSSRRGSLNYTHDAINPSYQVSKAALNMFTRILASRLDGRVTVSSVHPGAVKTDMGMADASMTAAEAAGHIFKLANSRPPTGQFWFKGEKFPW